MMSLLSWEKHCNEIMLSIHAADHLMISRMEINLNDYQVATKNNSSSRLKCLRGIEHFDPLELLR